ncbi:hypothetical protein TRFO_36613 [Tritrichomonas foetus]|uniref:Prominin n=1 Tax=Tritrichomonas foetus TaxID=1144522 RepID=A0A1J4JI51_9EUKA|nr:hypothetical protein TRFO_36613 [Tritrichomonas foetus]|eukprot:OHS97197.1 hypothetical protein TRFO_36613 [Tritrichomonas foetus]
MILLFSLSAFSLSENNETDDSNNKCPFVNATSSTSFVHSLASPTKGLFKMFGFTDWYFDLLGFGACFALIFVIFCFWFLCAQLCSCCCCRPKHSRKPSLALIILFLISAAFFISSTIMFLISAINLSKGLSEFTTVPGGITAAFDSITDVINVTLLKTFDSMEGFTDTVIFNIQHLISFLSTNVNEKQRQAKNIKTNLTIYTSYFNKSSTETDKNGEKYNKGFLDIFNKLNKSKIQVDEYFKGSLNHTAPQLMEIADKMIDGAASLNETVETAQNSIDENLGQVKDLIDEQKGNIGDYLSEVRSAIDPLTEQLDPIANLVDQIAVIINLVAYLGTASILFVAVIYIIAFFFRCCCTRCLMAWFHCFGFCLNLLIILPAVIFATLFVAFDTYCYQAEELVADLIDIGLTKDEIKSLFTCPVNLPVYELGFDKIFDYHEILDQLNEVPKQLESAMNVSDIKGLDNFDNFTDGMNFDDKFKAEVIIYQYNIQLPKIAAANKEDESKINDIMIYIQSKDQHLEDTKWNMKDLSSFATAVQPTIDSSIENTTALSENFVNETKTLIEGGFNNITCMTFRCMYSPIKNTLCAILFDAATFWTISALCMIIGISLMSCVICQRRKGLLNPQVQPLDDEDENQELVGFSAGTPL